MAMVMAQDKPYKVTMTINYVLQSDCNDGDGGIHPNSWYCNGMDDDCNGSIDDSAVDTLVYYTDGDMDGHGSLDHPVISCPSVNPNTLLPDPPLGLSVFSDDCDDFDAGISPSAAELCTPTIDENCDGDAVYNAIDALCMRSILIKMVLPLWIHRCWPVRRFFRSFLSTAPVLKIAMISIPS